MFKNLFKKKESKTELVSPVTGTIVSLEEVPDPVFSQKMMGDGIAIKPSSNEIVSPAEGEIMHLPETKHAVGLKTPDGLEYLIHIGLETVSLEGKGFTAHVQAGDKVESGASLITCDFDYVREHASSDITPIVITNGQELGKTFTKTEENHVTGGETVIITAFDE